MKSTSTEQIKRKLKVLHNKLATIGPVMRGTVVLLCSTCGNPRCKCARGEKHPQYYFSVNIGKKTKMMYLGKQKKIEAEQYSENYKMLWNIIEEMTLLNLELLKSKSKVADD